MPGSRPSLSPSVRRTAVASKSRPWAGGRTLLLVDNRPLQRVAWAEFHTARKRLDKAAGELHRHEEKDLPAYDAWLHQTFPVLITTLRQLHEEVFQKEQKVRAVQAMSILSGRSLKKLWQELKEREANPKAFEEEADSAKDEDDEDFDDEFDFDDEDADDFWGDSDSKKNAHNTSRSSRRRATSEDAFEASSAPRSSAGKNSLAKGIYRRLVQRLHPDRGGEWTPVRERLWHQVQQAWASGDADWLTRLEVEWETANDVLGPTSPVGRLRMAIEELHGARRDIERKLREYRGSPGWRFTLSEKNRRALYRRTEENLHHDSAYLRSQLDYLNATIAAWEKGPRSAKSPKSDGRKKPASGRRSQNQWNV